MGLGAASLLWLQAWYSTLGSGPMVVLSKFAWFAMLGSLTISLASAGVASWLALREGAGRLLALVALAGAMGLFRFFQVFAIGGP